MLKKVEHYELVCGHEGCGNNHTLFVRIEIEGFFFSPERTEKDIVDAMDLVAWQWVNKPGKKEEVFCPHHHI